MQTLYMTEYLNLFPLPVLYHSVNSLLFVCRSDTGRFNGKKGNIGCDIHNEWAGLPAFLEVTRSRQVTLAILDNTVWSEKNVLEIIMSIVWKQKHFLDV